MSESFKPENATQIADVVAWAVSHEKPLEIHGQGSKRGIGRAARFGAALDTTSLTGITLYEPEELVLAARAGTPMSEVRAALGEHAQELAFEPPDFGVLLGGEPGQGTIGGTLACNLGGPRRIKAGAARDHFLGATAVSGRGEMFKTGGRVVKNVTGYDLCKVLAGSWGTLAVMSDVIVKVLPAAETQASVVVHGLAPADAIAAMGDAMRSAYEVSAAAYLPGDIARRSQAAPLSAGAASAVLLRIEGIEPSVKYRTDRLLGILKPYGRVGIVGNDASRTAWREIRNVDFFAVDHSRPVWRVSVPPAAGAMVLAGISAAVSVQGYFDWAGGLLWLAAPASDDGAAQVIRTAVSASGGHATLIRGSDALRSTIDVFEPPEAVMAMLSQRLKQNFDPSGVLNPGRMNASM